jgi:hypothetical protein
MPIKIDRPQANSLFPSINSQAVLREDFEAQIVKRLVAVTVRPPQPGGLDSKGRTRESFEEGAVEINRSPILNRALRRELRLQLKLDISMRMDLPYPNSFDPVVIPAFQSDRQINSGGSKSRSPIPSE